MSHLIEIRDMYKIYELGDEPVHALDGVSLSVDYGEFVDELRKTIDPVVNHWLAENGLMVVGEKAPVETIYTGSVP
ncbi:MAG: hypothetical protein IKO43_00160, partial [Kiritimatiellae bacterium]|nr:hypothetical protein [Kiritimatiellia bacterium]